MILLGLSGPARSGKDTAFSFIQQWAEENDRVAVRRGFADLMKQSMYRMFKPDCTVEEGIEWCDRMKLGGNLIASDPDGSVIEINGRVAIQRFGTEGHRHIFGRDFWIDILLPTERWQKNFAGADIAVVTDVRYPNEARRIKRLGQLWTVVRADTETVDSHASEVVLSEHLVGILIPNNGTLEEYRAEVHGACGIHLKTALKEDKT